MRKWKRTVLCLLLSAAVVALAPLAARRLLGAGQSRVDERLRPQKTRTVTVGLLGDDTGSEKFLKAQLAAFEKRDPALRVVLRRIPREELTAQDAVPPPLLLFPLFALDAPEGLLQPLGDLLGCREDAAACGKSRLVQYALPLWFSPEVLTLDAALFPDEHPARATPAATPLLQLTQQTPTPAPVPSALPELPALPWQGVLQGGALLAPQDVALLQLCAMCPAGSRPLLRDRLSSQLPPEPSLPAQPLARVTTYAAALKGDRLAVPLTPACSSRVLMAGLTRQDADALSLLTFLLGEESQAALASHGLFATREEQPFPATDALSAALSQLYARSQLFPNAFAHTRDGCHAQCVTALLSGEEPATALLRLR